ncbi:hypothetical protein HPB47_017511 [Ixodes persulcatus]|uniref:Uncharacterized protein n=1 Tax=Ixodes persulcatus TaxID=34615 RepID=A0AC60R008_IXOPE|nr:hypothetical protein HPB47_017511 [Ixodes persulcatus]
MFQITLVVGQLLDQLALKTQNTNAALGQVTNWDEILKAHNKDTWCQKWGLTRRKKNLSRNDTVTNSSDGAKKTPLRQDKQVDARERRFRNYGRWSKTPKPLYLSSESPDAWDDWLQSYEWYATAIQLQKKPPEVQVANFMTVVGPDAQNVFRTLLLSEDDKKNLDIVKQRFKEHFHPKVNHAYERYRFNQKQNEGETFN